MTLKGHTNWVKSAQFSRNCDKIVTASYDNTVKIWDTKTGNCITTLKGHTNDVRSAQFSRNCDKIATNTAKIWDIGEFLECQNFLTRRVTFQQAVILNCIYKIIVARRLVNNHGNNAFEEGGNSSGFFAQEEIILDFNTYPHLQKHYDDLPKALRAILDPYITKLMKDIQ